MNTDIMGLPGANTHVQWHYPPGTIRWRRMRQGDSTAKDAVPGWLRQRHLRESNPVTYEAFPNGKRQWWLREIKLEK